jgi:hypothetical protein
VHVDPTETSTEQPLRFDKAKHFEMVGDGGSRQGIE